MREVISLARAGEAWAVKHQDGFLGHANSYEEAIAIGRHLVSWLKNEGRAADLVVDGERRSFAAQDE